MTVDDVMPDATSNSVDERRELTIWEVPIAVACQRMEFSVRLTNCLINSPFATLGEAARQPNRELRAMPRMGPKTVSEFRATLEYLRQSTTAPDEDVVLWATEHRTLILALMRGEAFVTARRDQSDPEWYQ